MIEAIIQKTVWPKRRISVEYLELCVELLPVTEQIWALGQLHRDLLMQGEHLLLTLTVKENKGHSGRKAADEGRPVIPLPHVGKVVVGGYVLVTIKTQQAQEWQQRFRVGEVKGSQTSICGVLAARRVNVHWTSSSCTLKIRLTRRYPPCPPWAGKTSCNWARLRIRFCTSIPDLDGTPLPGKGSAYYQLTTITYF